MVTKPKATSAPNSLYEKVASSFGQTALASKMGKQVSDSAEEIWHAGLGAFSKAQSEGRKVFDTLVKQGEALEQHTRRSAEATLADVKGYAAEFAAGHASNTIEIATRKFDQLEEIFESRVRQSLAHLGVASSKDVELLRVQVAVLTSKIQALSAKMAAGKRPSSTPTKTTTAKKALQKSPATKLTKKPSTKSHKKINTTKRK